uniref:Uncharacterized protein n=1 Tax=Triticum urartu TaxID=4572 RepID=A0A8R7TWD2_TRIUA
AKENKNQRRKKEGEEKETGGQSSSSVPVLLLPLRRRLPKARFEEGWLPRPPSPSPWLHCIGIRDRLRSKRPWIILRRVLILLLEECPQPALLSSQHQQSENLQLLMIMQYLMIQVITSIFLYRIISLH